MALDFPNSPSIGATYTGQNGVMWQYDGAKWINGTNASNTYAPLNSPNFTGNPTAPNPQPGDSDTSIATTAFVAASAQGNVGRNLLHNSMFNVAQRGTGPWAAAGYTLDRWAFSMANDLISVSSVTLSDAARASIGDETAKSAIGNTFTGSPISAAYNAGYQHVEDARRLAGKTVTVSFWAQASLAGIRLGISFIQHMGSGGSPSTDVQLNGQSVALGVGFARYNLTFTIPSLSGKTLGMNNDHSTILYLIFSAEASRNAWSGSVGVQSGTINIWGVQLEIGSVATPLEKLDPRMDLANCQRFYQVLQGVIASYGLIGSTVAGMVSFSVTMRAPPTFALITMSDVNVSSPSYNAVAGNSGMWLGGVPTATGGFIINRNFTASADL